MRSMLKAALKYNRQVKPFPKRCLVDIDIDNVDCYYRNEEDGVLVNVTRPQSRWYSILEIVGNCWKLVNVTIHVTIHAFDSIQLKRV